MSDATGEGFPDECREVRQEEFRDTTDYPLQDGLESDWLLLDAKYRDGPPLSALSHDEFRQSFYESDNALAAVCGSITMGFYPPPEVLMVLAGRWREYIDANGEKSLESVMVGRSKQRSGNYAQQRNRRLQPQVWALEIARRVASGATRNEAAEALCNEWGLSQDPDSVLRIVRRSGAGRLWTKRNKKA